MTDTELLRGLRRGETAAVEHIIDRYGAYVAAVVHNTLGSLSRPEDVEELSSDVFLAMWQSRDKLRRAESLKPWLAAVARNRARSFLRSMGETTEAAELMEFLASDGAEDLVLQQEERLLLESALEALGEPEAEIFRRRFYRGESVPQIAAAMALHPENVKTRLRRGREKLKKRLEKGGFEP